MVMNIIGIICAMKVEVEGLKVLMTQKEEHTYSKMNFTKGYIGDNQIIAVECGVGKVNAAMTAQTMILKYKPDFIVNSGVAGGLDSELDIADIAIATDVVQHDVDTTVFGDPEGYITNLNLVNIPIEEKIFKTLAECAGKIPETKVKCGTIATGDQFISTPYQKNLLKDKFDAIATEMEGGAVGHVCYANGVKFGVIRAISDSATGDALMDYETFKVIAAKKTTKIKRL